jgi:iron complex outermembrane recepter protein
VAFTSGANPLLQPEESRGKNLGFVWSPGGFLEGANIGIDWWNIKVENTMVADSPNQILTDCYVDNIQARCGLFTRDATLGFVNNLSFGLRNAGYVEHEGVDVELAYQWETDFGNFSSSLLSTYMIGQEFKSTNDAAARPTQQTSLGSNYRLRSNFNLSWEYRDFGISWGARYYSKMKEACLNATLFPGECSDPGVGRVTNSLPLNTNVLGSNTFHDLQLRWKASWDAVVAIGANNVTDHIGPPTYSQIDSNVPYNGGFDIGRFWYIKYQQNF